MQKAPKNKRKFSSNPKPVIKRRKTKINDFLFDDCPICQALKAAEKEGRSLSLSETKAAFQKARIRKF